MSATRSILVSGLCFVAGAGASLSWRVNCAQTMTMKPAADVAARTKEEPRNAAAGAGQPASEKQIFGRIECIEGLTKALASASAKDIDEWSKRLSATDVFQACEMLADAPKSESRDKALRRAINSAAMRDPFRAFGFLARLGADRMGEDPRRFVITNMVEKDPKQTWDTLSKAAGLAKSDVEQIAGIWGRTQGHAAATFGMALRDPIQRSVFLRKAIAQWIGEDVASFSKWFAQQ